MEKKSFIVFGETLEDCYPCEKPSRKCVGGAPLNVAAMSAAQGIDSHIITCLGIDEGSRHVLETLKQCGIMTDLVQENPSSILCHTEVQVDDKTGERSFRFFKENASFLKMDYSSDWEKEMASALLLHIGTVCLLDDKIIEVQKRACLLAQEKDCLISLDPNFRPSLFSTERQAFLTRLFLPYTAILKVGKEEFFALTGKESSKSSLAVFFEEYPSLKLALVTMGKEGMDLYRRDDIFLHQDAIPTRKMVDTLGCGDITYGAFLSELAKRGLLTEERLGNAPEKELSDSLLVAAVAGSLECERKGALPVPSQEEIKERLASLAQ